MKKYFLLLFLLLILCGFFYFDAFHYLNFTTLRQHRYQLLQWAQTHYILTVFCYIAFYSIMIAISIPGGAILTLTGGFLFGTWLGTGYAVIGATLGATLFFLSIKLAFADWLNKKLGHWLQKFEKQFKENAFNYLLTLRVIPLFPFWFVNVMSALLNIRLPIFMSATCIGIIPSTFIYASLGNGLGIIFDTHETPNFSIIFTPTMLLPLIGLGLLALLPVLYKRYKR